eukprot:GEMP01002549.1.p1 GENE.GEMP01002549.1~~GEMP01002549.1.p1  ORF type:complete len:1215 (+),score=317.57 GEMP01002549.1:306-3950(+)
MADAPRNAAQTIARKEDVSHGGAGRRDEAGAFLSLRHVFGLKPDVRCNVHYVDETQLLYPAGHNTVLYNTEQKTQRLFPGTPDAESITCLALSPNKRYLAVGERAERAICTIFDVVTGKRRKVLNFEFEARSYVCMAFSQETKFLITQSGPPDWHLIYWAWDKARPLAALKLAQGNIRECSISPQDSTLCCVIGDGVFKFLRMQEGVLKGLPNQLAKLRESQNQNYTCHAWMHDDRLVLCTESGDILLFDQGSEFKMVLPCSPNAVSGTQAHRSLLTIAAYSKGFVCGGDKGQVKVFERSDDPKEVFRKAKDMCVDQSEAITCLAVTPSDEFVAVTVANQLYQLSLSSDLLKTEDGPSFDYLLTSFHTGSILGVDICARKPLIVTCGADKTIRVWNYITKTCELWKAFNEEAYSVAFHPSGFHLIAGFSDKLRLLNLLMEDMRTFKEIPIKACKEVRFANGGHYFAAVNNNTIQVYRTYTCEVVCNLRSHNAKVKALSWAADDSSLVSCGLDGSVYEFSIIKEGQRLQDWMHKGTSFNSVCAYQREHIAASGGKEKKEDEKMQQQGIGSKNALLLAGSDKMIKEIHNSQLVQYIECNVTMGQLCLTNQAPRSILSGVAENECPGALRWYNFPLDGDYTEYQAHALSVVRMAVTFDDTIVVSAGEDGTLFIWDINKKVEGKKRDAKEALPFADEILVTRTFLDDKRAALLDLERQVEELSNQIEFQLRHRDAYHKDKMSELEDKYGQEIEQERTKYELLREEKNEMEMEYEDNTKNLEGNHAKQAQDLEGSFQHKMTIEVQRYQKLMQDLDRERQSWHSQHTVLIRKHDTVIEDLKLKFEEKQKTNRTDRQHILEEKEGAFADYQDTQRQLEEDADREIEELKELYEAKLAQEKDEKVRLRGQAGIHRKHHEDLKRQMNKKEEELKSWVDQNKKKQEMLDQFGKDKETVLKEIKERDKTIADKDTRIYELKKQNQELEKFKFVLDYKIKELKAQIDPKNDDIAEMRQQIHAMDAELEDYMRKNKQLALDISQLQLKHKALQEEKKDQKKKLKENLRFIKTFKLDLHEAVQNLQDPKKLKESVAQLYRKLVQGTTAIKESDVDKSQEYNRQRDYLERSVDSLKRKLEKDSQVHRTDNMRIMGENVALIREINDLRRELNSLKHERNSEAQPQKPTITKQMLAKQRDEIAKLTSHMEELEVQTARVPQPGTQLSPLA